MTLQHTPSSSRTSHPRITRASREEVRRTTRLALLLIGAGLLFATMLFVRFG